MNYEIPQEDKVRIAQVYHNPQQMQALKNYLLQQVNQQVLDLVYSGKDPQGVAEAKRFVENAFKKLEADFKTVSPKAHKPSR